jgi:8-oxo-dGTP pyrophosphatase MutT (NUDIX family)
MSIGNMYKSYEIPISVKCIVFEDGKVWLRKNERNEWELPGGKLDKGEQPEQTAIREAQEELGVTVKVGQPVGATVYTIRVSADEKRGVFVIAYICEFVERLGDVEHEGEAGKAEFKSFSLGEVANLNMPNFYKDWIMRSVAS